MVPLSQWKATPQPPVSGASAAWELKDRIEALVLTAENFDRAIRRLIEEMDELQDRVKHNEQTIMRLLKCLKESADIE